MGFRFFRSIPLGKHLRINLSKTGVGLSGGVRGARYSMHSSGRRTTTVGVPGTGVSYRRDRYSRASKLPPPPKLGGAPMPAPPGRVVPWSRVFVGTAATFLLIGVIGSIGDASDDRVMTATSPAASSTPSPSPSPEQTAAPAPAPAPTTKVPDVTGQSATSAERDLKRASLLVTTDTKYSHAPAGTVIRQSIAGGERTNEGHVITLVVARAYPTVPSVLGDHVPAARNLLQDRGYDVRVSKQISSQPAGTIIGTNPDPGTEVLPGRTITLIVAKPAPSTGTGGGGSCHPSYTGACLDPNASDYDCAGGSGDGPKYTGLVHVVGPDVFGLDADGDGVGCE
jgi:hypothetical protein